MNELRDLIEVTGNLVEEAWNNGRREAMKEIQGGKYERIEEVNSALRGQIDNYEKLRAERSKEIDRLTAQVRRYEEQLKMLHEIREEAEEENERLREALRETGAEDLQATVTALEAANKVLGEKLEKAQARIEELETNQETEPKPKPCPFCGGLAEVNQIRKGVWYVACGNSDCQVNPDTNIFNTETEAIEAWNHRAGDLTCDWR